MPLCYHLRLMEEKKIRIAFQPGPVLSHQEMQEFQDDLKDISREDLDKLCKEIIETDFAFAPHVWRNSEDGREGEVRWMIVDAHQRKRALSRLESEGWTIPKFHTIEVFARDYAEAKRRVLQGTSQYGKMSPKGLFDFSQKAGLSFDSLQAFRFPDVNMPSFRAEFFTQKVPMPNLQSGDRQPFQQITFTLHDSQAEIVKNAMAVAKQLGKFTDELNENNNGNALARICEAYLASHVVS